MKYVSTYNIIRVVAFTLAEILIVLGIIGIVAEMTIPTLINNVNDQATVVALKKEKSVLQQTILNAYTEEGPTDYWYSGSVVTDANAAVNTVFAKYLKVMKNCGVNSGCIPSGGYKNLSGATNSPIDYDTSSYSKMILADGTILIIDASLYNNKNGDLSLYVDVNGLKAPNCYGEDLFWFLIYSTSSFNDNMAWWVTDPFYKPQVVLAFDHHTAGSLKTTTNCSKTVVSGYAGRGCGAWVIEKGNLDYKYVDDLDWQTKTHK